jgi:hypothetical protein
MVIRRDDGIWSDTIWNEKIKSLYKFREKLYIEKMGEASMHIRTEFKRLSRLQISNWRFRERQTTVKTEEEHEPHA